MAVYRLIRLRMECYNSIVMYSGKKVMPFSAFKSFVSKVYHENKIITSILYHENKIGWLRIRGTLEKFEHVIPLEMIDAFVEMPSVLNAYEALRQGKRINPIDGAFKFEERRFRVNIYLGLDGINVAIRLLSDEILPLEKLFLPPEVKPFARIKSGMYLVTGSTGSGKSTSLYAAVSELNKKDRCIITFEDPVEYRVPGIVQVQINHAMNVTFPQALKSGLRQDIEIALVGEIRDAETASIMLSTQMFPMQKCRSESVNTLWRGNIS